MLAPSVVVVGPRVVVVGTSVVVVGPRVVVVGTSVVVVGPGCCCCWTDCPAAMQCQFIVRELFTVYGTFKCSLSITNCKVVFPLSASNFRCFTVIPPFWVSRLPCIPLSPNADCNPRHVRRQAEIRIKNAEYENISRTVRAPVFGTLNRAISNFQPDLSEP